MSIHADKSPENKSQALASERVEKQGVDEFSGLFVDARPSSIAQRKLQTLVNNHSHSSPLNTFQLIAHNSHLTQQAMQLQAMAKHHTAQHIHPVQMKKNNTGLPDDLKTGMENLSGMSLDHVKVHYNSSKPAAVQAHAYAQGSEIHLASGQEQHLPHELGHVIQQAQGRVQPTTSIGGVQVNDNPGLESEATAMGSRALQMVQAQPRDLHSEQSGAMSQLIQRATEDLTLNGKTSTVATSMTKTLDPTSPPGYGQASSADSDLDAIMETLPTDPAHETTKKFVKGHLLNDNLGGMANKNNLYPITGKANKDHLDDVESKIKTYIDGGVGAPITYTVNVTNRSVVTKEMKPKKVGGRYANIDTPKATFDCTTTGGTGFSNLTNKQITSEAETRS